MYSQSCVIATLFFIGSPFSLSGGILGVDATSSYINEYGIGLPSWQIFTNVIDAAFGGPSNVAVIPGLLTDLPEMLSYSALLVELRGSGPGVTLTATEAANLYAYIYAYIASERRVVIFGENHNWDS
jgi:hypothetical protein